MIFDISARRAAGVRHPIRDGILDDGRLGLRLRRPRAGGLPGHLDRLVPLRRRLLPALVRADERPARSDRLIDPLDNLWHYHQEAYKFHTGLSTKHQYQSWPWKWLLLGRPVGVLLEHRRAVRRHQLRVRDPAARHAGAVVVVPAGADRAWAGWPSPAATAAPGSIMACALAGIVPWFQYDARPPHDVLLLRPAGRAVPGPRRGVRAGRDHRPAAARASPTATTG